VQRQRRVVARGEHQMQLWAAVAREIVEEISYLWAREDVGVIDGEDEGRLPVEQLPAEPVHVVDRLSLSRN
jgi:adenylate kinase